jgi:hypothetical protein
VKINFHGIAAAFTTILGVVSSPAVFHALPASLAGTITGIGVVWAALTHAAVQTSTGGPIIGS